MKRRMATLRNYSGTELAIEYFHAVKARDELPIYHLGPALIEETIDEAWAIEEEIKRRKSLPYSTRAAD